MSNIKTLWDLLINYGVVIPPIQRDYAQGRKTKHATKVRKKFLDSLENALTQNHFLHLDFIYGKIYGIKNEEEVTRNLKAIKSLLKGVSEYALSIDLKIQEPNIIAKKTDPTELVYFVPLDGQQRLTTLFLIHWYFLKRLNQDLENFKKTLRVLNNFRYKTRRSSTSFLKLITNEETIIDFENDIYDEITYLEFFSISWLKDPTVVSMLNMIQEIDLKFKNSSKIEIKAFWHSLTIKKLIWFDFLNLKDFELSEDLYIKMNARGKQLTSFENFKAWMLTKLEKENLFPVKNFKEYSRKLDVEWNDIFWKNKHKNHFSIDDSFLNFFKIIFLYDNVKRAELKNTNFKNTTKEFLFIENVTKNISFDWEEFFDDHFFHNIITYFNLLSYCEIYKEESNYRLKEFFKFLFSSKSSKPSWQELLSSYLTISFLQHKTKALHNYDNNDFNHLNAYYRIMFNLFNNSIIDNPSLYKRSILEVDQLNKKLRSVNYNIREWVYSFKTNEMSVFSKNQVQEEILKYKLFDDSKWKEIIIKAEKVKYFKGQLNFWFYMLDIPIEEDCYNTNFLNDSKLKSRFERITFKIQRLFNDDGLNRTGKFEKNIFERALLSGTDYLLPEKNYKCFCRDTGRDVSWKRFFLRDRNKEQTNLVLKDIFNLDFNNPNTSFGNYIESNLSSNNLENWRLSFVNNKQLFDKLGNRRYIREISNHGWVIVKDNYKTYVGPHYELFSLSFFLKHLKGEAKEFSPFNKIDYFPAPKKSNEIVPCVYLNLKTKNLDYALDIRYINNRFDLRFFARTDVIDDRTAQILINLKFTKKENEFFIQSGQETDCLNFLKSLSQKLQSSIGATL